MDGKTLLWLLFAVGAVLAAVTLVIAVKLCVRLFRTKRLLTEAGVPLQGKLAFWAAVAYLICPVDLLPDPIFIDDIGFLLLALRSLDKSAVRAGVDLALPRKRP
jgi:uncharacterized membrane protein YkvA (DUF1232 family)